jgi:threonine/homoserine/homoserine lactone efflux protein
MVPELLLSLVAFAMVATISPGGATTLATASGAQYGIRQSIPLLAGIAFGLGSLMGAVAGGMGSVIHSFPQIQLWLRLAGSAYLLWLAWTVARAGASKDGSSSKVPTGFVTGFLLLWVNPKAWTMAVAAASGYAAIASGPLVLALTLGAVFFLTAGFSLTVWCAGGMWLARQLTAPWQWRALNASLALLLALSIVPLWL